MPFKYKSDLRKYNKSYYIKNKKRILKNVKRYRKTHPWAITYKNIDLRIKERGTRRSKYYFNKGIKNFLDTNDLKYLWFRDKAYLMEKPSIDRRNSDKNYTLDNCRYIEYSMNCKKRR